MNGKSKIPSENVKKSLDYSNTIRSLGIVGITILVALGISFFSPYFFTTRNILNVLRQSSFLLLLAIGQTIVIIARGIDLSVASTISISGCIAAYFVIILNGNLFIAFTIAVLCGGIIGLINALLITIGKMEPFLATLSTMIIGSGLLLYVTGGVPVVPYVSSFTTLGRGYLSWIPIPIIIVGIIAFIFHIITSNTVFGKHIYALGGNPNAARVSGINVERTTCYAYIISGLLAGLAGVMLASRLASGQPAAGTGMELMSIAASVVGGASFFGGEGSIYGTVTGVLLIGIIGNGLNLLNVSSFLHQVVIGTIIIIAIIVDRNIKRRGLN